MRRSIVIVGAGPGGLAAAMLLATTGARVTVLERRDRVGGRSAAMERNGFRFDTGPTFFLYPRILGEIFAACGARLEDEVELTKLDTLYRLVFEAGDALTLKADSEATKAEVRRLCPADADRLDAYLADNRRKLDLFKPVLETPFTSAAAFLKPDVLKALRLLRPWNSLDNELRRYFSDERVRLAFSFQSKYLGMSPFRCPSLFSILSFLEHEHGVFHPGGGCGAVMEAMARIARRMGVDIRTGEEVRDIEFRGRRPAAVVTAQARYDCDALVINADFADAMRRLVPGKLRRRWSDRKIEAKKFSCSTFMIYLGLDGAIPELEHHTIYLARDYARNLAEIEEGRELPRRPSLYVQNATRTDSTLAPPGCSTLYVLVPVGHQKGLVDWSVEKRRYRDLVLDRLGDLGLHDLDRRIRFERIITPEEWEQGFRLHRGATFSLAHSLDQMLTFRPNNRFEELDGVYLVGGGTHPGSGLPVIFEGARISAGLLAGDLGLSKPWQTGDAKVSGQTERRVA